MFSGFMTVRWNAKYICSRERLLGALLGSQSTGRVEKKVTCMNMTGSEFT
jgi:hypothetical protein